MRTRLSGDAPKTKKCTKIQDAPEDATGSSRATGVGFRGVHEPQPKHGGTCTRGAGAVQSSTSGASTEPRSPGSRMYSPVLLDETVISLFWTIGACRRFSFSNFRNDETPEIVDKVAALTIRLYGLKIGTLGRRLQTQILQLASEVAHPGRSRLLPLSEFLTSFLFGLRF